MALDSPLPSAFDALGLFVPDQRPSVFLDYDGTLTPIVSRPGLAVFDPAMRATVARLAAVAEVAVVTGRDLEDARALLALPGITIAGSHGFDVEYPDGRRVILGGGNAYLDALDAAATEVEPRLRGIPGAHLERKRFGFALHYRETPPERHEDVVALAAAAAGAHSSLRVAHGKMVVELRPDADWHKGRLVLALLAERDAREAPTVYIGDDRTDEDAFEALGDLDPGTVTVVVGERASGPTAARYALDDVGATRQWLQMLTGRLGG